METLTTQNEELKRDLPPPAASEKSTETRSGSRMVKLSSLLRGIGAAVLIAAAVSFMLQQWDSLDYQARYFAFLGFTLVLSAGGMFCGFKMQDNKGARTFFALSAAVIPVHFLQLGGLLYSRFMAGDIEYPSYALWIAPSDLGALLTTGIGLALIVPVCALAFSCLVRSNAKLVTSLYLGMNTVLLIPIRDVDVSGFFAIGMALVLCFMEGRGYAEQPAMRTGEGKLVRVMLGVPLFLLFARTVQLYPTSALFVACLLAVLGLINFVLTPNLPKKGSALQALSTIPAVASLLIFISEMQLPDSYFLTVLGLSLSGLLLLMGRYSIGSGVGYRKTAAVALMTLIAYQLMLFPGVFSAFMCILIGIIMTAYGYSAQYRLIFVFGLLGVAAGLIYHVKFASALITYSPWVSLAVLGMGVIVTASYLERNHKVLLARALAMKESFQEWK